LRQRLKACLPLISGDFGRHITGRNKARVSLSG
jgi:hypothetical protein